MFSVEKAANNNQYYAVNSNNFSSTSCSFQVNLNGSASITDRNFLLNVPVLFTLTSTVTATNVHAINSTYDAMCSFPLAKAMAALTVTIATQQVTILVSDIMKVIERYSPLVRKYLDYSLTPVMPDACANYIDLITTQRNPLGSFTTGVDEIMPRGAFPIIVATNPASTVASGTVTATVYATLTEPLFISPLLQTFVRKCGFSHITNIAINISWQTGALLGRMWRHIDATGQSGGSFSSVVTFPSAPTLYVVQSLPSLLLPVPPVITLPYDEIISYPSAPQTLQTYAAPSSTSSLVSSNATSQTFQLSRIPKEAYLYVTDYNNNTGFNSYYSDRFYPITGVTAVFNTQTLLSGASQYDLFKINCTNGSNQTWIDYQGQAMNSSLALMGTSGSPLCLKFGKDICLPSESWAVGCNVKSNLQFQITFVNNNPTAQNSGWQVVFYVIIVYAGAINLYGQNNSLIVIAPLSEADVEHAQKLDRRIHYDIVENMTLNGGSFFSGVKNFISDKAIPFLKAVRNHPLYNVVSSAAKSYARKSGNPYAAAAANVADALGLGDGVTGGARKHRGRPKKHHAKGGAHATHAMLKHALLGRGEDEEALEGAGEIKQGVKETKKRGRPSTQMTRDNDCDSLEDIYNEYENDNE